MPRPREPEETEWMQVVGRALSFLALHYADMRSKTLVEQADFLARFGLPRSEAATILGTTEGSLGVMTRRRQSGRKAAGRRKTQARVRRTGGR